MDPLQRIQAQILRMTRSRYSKWIEEGSVRREREFGLLDIIRETNLIFKLLAEVAQLVEHGTENAGVDSSILSLGTTLHKVTFVTPIIGLRHGA